MFHLMHKSTIESIKLDIKNKNKILNIYLPKHPIKRAEFSFLKKNNENLQANSKEKNSEVKINYNIEDTRYFNGLLIALTSIGTIFIYEIYSKKLKKIVCFASEELRAKGIHLNSIRKSLIITLFACINDINNIQCFEIPFEYLIKKEIIKINDFIRILKSEEILDSECYVQFDEYNKIILTRNILRTNKIWNFEKYTQNLEFTYTNLNEIRLTGGSCLICEKTNEIRKYNIHIFDINNGDILQKIINNNLSCEIKQNDICCPINNNYPFVICWHLAKVSFSKSSSSLRADNNMSISSFSNISIINSNNNSNKKNCNNFNEISGLNMFSPIFQNSNERNNIIDNNFNINLYSPLSSNNPNNI